MMRTSLLLSAVLLLAACPDPAKNKPQAVVSTPKQEANVAPLEGAVAFPFSQADSKFGFVGAKVTAKHPGGFNTFGGVIELVGGDLSKSRVRAQVDASSVFTDSEKLSGHLKSPDFFDVAQFPTATFVSTAIKANGDAFDVTGDLTLHGVTKTITFPAKIAVAEGEITVAAEFAINRKDFGIVYPGQPDNLIADNVAISLDLHAKKKG